MFDPEYQVCLRSSARTDTGRVRSNNEDNIHLWIKDDRLILAIVADGMGGAVAGEEASRIAVETIRDDWNFPNGWRSMLAESNTAIDLDKVKARLQASILKANNLIVDRSVENPELKGMGTTITIAFIHDTDAIIAHVGDSRAYLIEGDGYYTQITSDHTLVQALVDAGHIDEEQAVQHPMKNVLYRALGQARDLEVDIYSKKLHISDRLVLCSDGLTLHVRPKEIAELAMIDDPNESSQKLIHLANERGGQDNISVIVVKVEADAACNQLKEEQIVDTETEMTSKSASEEQTTELPKIIPPNLPSPEKADNADSGDEAQTTEQSIDSSGENRRRAVPPDEEQKSATAPSDITGEGHDPAALLQ